MTTDASLNPDHSNNDSEVREEYLTVRQTAEILNCSDKTIRKLVTNRQIPFIKLGGMIRIPSDKIVNSASYYPSISPEQRKSWR